MKPDAIVMESQGTRRVRVYVPDIDGVVTSYLGCGETWLIFRTSYISDSGKATQVTVEMPLKAFDRLLDLYELSQMDQFGKQIDGGDADNPPKT